MKKTLNILNGILYALCLPFAGIAYVIVDTWRNFKRKKHHKQLRKQGRATLSNPYADKWN